MKFCKHCGGSLQEGKSFCRHCGEAVITPEGENKFCKGCGGLLKGEDCKECVSNDQVEVTSKFCKACGDELEDDEECRRCAEPSTRYCKHCGTAMAESETYCAGCNGSMDHQPVIYESTPTIKKKKPRPLLIFLVIFLVFLAGSATYGYFYVKDASLPSHTTDTLLTALEKKDVSSLQNILADSSDTPLTRTALKDFLEQLHGHPDVYAKLVKDLKRQEDTLTTSTKDKMDPFLFQLKESSEKRWLFINQYTVELIPVTFTLETDRDAKVFMNDKEVPASGIEARIVENVLPGKFTFKAIKNGEWGEFETSESVFIWENTDQPIPLLFDEQYITVTSDFEGAEIYLNGEPYGNIEDSTLMIGPVSAGDTVAVSGTYSYPWEDVYSEEVTASASDTIQLDFPIGTSVVLDDLTSDIISYNSSYIEAITRVDASLLRNVKGKLLEDHNKTLKNLQKRSITYGGYLTDMIFDRQSFSIEEENGGYKASINVEEHYASSWNDPSDPDVADFIPKIYYYTYYCEYDEAEAKWVVYDAKEHDRLTIVDPL
ncbi:hypothetical protein LCM10_09765 [Rossellomorea aquimaris]|uniref:TcaA 3rd/4th domain-containing protein n=1 Tax=Rossellomorea aquimaris TaxID=189382 RepID=UPI001CD6D6FD|nr:hypothetical protein [Rossellomorea aquimaris]MCA1055269.1 hypothetical protein [Rossellomorea aquimaris]